MSPAEPDDSKAEARIPEEYIAREGRMNPLQKTMVTVPQMPNEGRPYGHGVHTEKAPEKSRAFL